MDALNRWFDQYTQTPVGGILLMLFVFLARVTMDELLRRREKKRKPKRKEGANG